MAGFVCKKFSMKSALLLAAGVSVLAFSSPVSAQHGVTDNVDAPSLTIQASISSALGQHKIQKRRLFDHVALQGFYDERAQRPLWVSDHGLSAAAQTMLETIEEAWTHGLNPKTYHVEEIKSLSEKRDYASKAQLELLLSDAFLRYVRDMSGMRVSAASMNLDASHWKRRIESSEALALLKSGAHIEHVLAKAAPKGATYKKLRMRLIDLVESGEIDRTHKSISLNGILRPGNSHRSIPLFRDRLGLRQPTRGKYSFDDHLADAVKAFQRDNGLPADGVIGSQTIAMLNKNGRDKAYQIVANMERFRWVDLKSYADRMVVVNIPSATLWALEDGDVKLEMPVIVGKPARATRSFVTEIQGMRFNPTWTVPPTIKRNDIIPKLKENPGYLADKGMSLLRGYGRNTEELDPYSIDWSEVSWQEANAMRMVQKPGRNNALGQYRVLMPNKHNIYLHDTNRRDYFKRPNRALSSGCVRMKYPDKMAEFIMSDEQNWGKKRIKGVLSTGKKTDAQISEPIPVYILYYTAWIGDGGEIVLGHDLYKKDRKLIKLLQKIDGFALPRQNS